MNARMSYGWIVLALVACGPIADDESSSGLVSEPTPTRLGQFTIDAQLSPWIATVGIVRWSWVPTEASVSVDRAVIEFGLPGEKRRIVPVDLTRDGWQTELIGMKASRRYEATIVVETAHGSQRSEDFGLETGALDNRLVQPEVSGEGAGAGYVIASTLQDGAAFVLDADGDYVWWAFPGFELTSRARMSYAADSIWVRNVNLGGPWEARGQLVQYALSGEELRRVDAPRSHHDFTVLPDGSLTVIEYDGADCDDIVEIGPEGQRRVVVRLGDHLVPTELALGCHANSILYHPERDAYTVSLLGLNAYIEVSRAGKIAWLFGGDLNRYRGIQTWVRQHGHQVHGETLVMFNNGETGERARVLEFRLDHAQREAESVFEYEGALSSPQFGDVQRLGDRELLVTYSIAGVIQRVDRNGALLGELAWPLGGGVGYAMYRDSLAGPPPK